MKANELRIGNLVYSGLNSKDVIEVYPMFIVQLSKIENETHNIKPIPLTEEWFYKLGGLRFNLDAEKKHYQIGLFTFRLEKDGFILLNDDNTECFFGFKPIRYVHQLQNLYFELTGEELILKQ